MTDKNREFAELCGICWHEFDWDAVNNKYYCVKCREWLADFGPGGSNPDFAADPRLVLREMRKRSDFGSFIKWVCGDHCSQGVRIAELVTDTTGLLRDKAISWIKGKQ